jgi:hypothetical protein
MNNLLETAADNIFITSANILDAITYRFSNTATDMTVPNNNDTLIAPLTEQLAKDYDVFNQVLNDYAMNINTCRYILSGMKIKTSKEKVLKEKREKQRLEEEERAKIQKQKEDADKLALKELENEKPKEFQNISSNATPISIDNTNNNNHNNTVNSNNINDNVMTTNSNRANDNDMIMDLDLDTFNFDGANNDIMNFNFEESMNLNTNSTGQAIPATADLISNNGITGSAEPIQQQQQQQQQQPEQQQKQQQQQQPSAPLSATTGNEYLNFEQDADLEDLNLNFLQDDEMGNLIQNMNDVNGSTNSKNDNSGNINDDPIAADQMEQLFSQFDEMVGNGI